MNGPDSAGRTLLEYGVSSLPAPGQDESGDLYLVQDTPGGALAGVVDGVGHGVGAAGVARQAVDTLRAHCREGVIPLVNRCHALLKRTRGVVMSLVSFCGAENTITWLGVGNVEGLLLRRNSPGNPGQEPMLVRPGLVGYRLPPLQALITPISAGDLLILTTDGIRAEFGHSVPHEGPPDRIAEYICSHFRRGEDDALVLALRYLGWNR